MLAEAPGSRTQPPHARRGATDFEDRESHRAPFASRNLPYDNSPCEVHRSPRASLDASRLIQDPRVSGQRMDAQARPPIRNTSTNARLIARPPTPCEEEGAVDIEEDESSPPPGGASHRTSGQTRRTSAQPSLRTLAARGPLAEGSSSNLTR